MLILSESHNYLDEKIEVCEGKLKVINKPWGQEHGWAGERPCLRQRQWGHFPVDTELVFVLFFAQEESDLLIKQRIYWPGCQGQTSLEPNWNQTIPFKGPQIHSPLCAAQQPEVSILYQPVKLVLA